MVVVVVGVRGVDHHDSENENSASAQGVAGGHRDVVMEGQEYCWDRRC